MDRGSYDGRLPEEIVDVLRRKGPMSQADIGLTLGFDRVGFHRRWIVSTMTQLKRAGVVRRDDHGTSARWSVVDLYQHAVEP